jgi:hypothetical protein
LNIILTLWLDYEGLRGSGVSAATRITEGDFNFGSSLKQLRARSSRNKRAVGTRDYLEGTSARQRRGGKRARSKFNKEALEREVAAHKATSSRRLNLQWAGTIEGAASS